ncbi:MAG TPA: hypothetical protein PKH43_07340, partial [Saprospiraceae bacterium]|nr:hypothetical protein [Saprospiraceae bacterium]
MKTFFTLLCISAATLIYPLCGTAQNFVAVDDSLCIYEDELSTFHYNVLDNDIVPDSIFIVPMGQSSCFFLSETGDILVSPAAENCCDVPHKFKYRIANCDSGPQCMALVTIMVKCRKPDCALVNLADLPDDGAGTPAAPCISSCEHATATYYVPYAPGATYSWSVAGGTYVAGGNPAEIIVSWGAAGPGLISLSINGG